MLRFILPIFGALFLAMTSTASAQHFVTLSSGVQYHDEVVGTGPQPQVGQTVTVHYTGWLDDHGKPGRKFDSSRDRGKPFSFTLGVENRCVVPFSSFAEPELQSDGRRPPAWFAFDETRPLAFFAGIWTRWASVRKVKEGETTNDLFGFLTTEPNTDVGVIHPKAMPVILINPDEIELWMTGTPAEALTLQRPLADNSLRVVARGAKDDGGGFEADQRGTFGAD